MYRQLGEARESGDLSLLDLLEERLADLSATIDDLYEAEAVRGWTAEPTRLGDLQAALDELGAAAIEYAICGEVILAICVTADDARTFVVDMELEHVERLVGQVRSAIEALETPQLAELSDLLITPIADLLDEGHLVLVPDGALHALPFELLPGTRGRALMQQYSISRAPSLQIACSLGLNREHRRPETWSLAAATSAVGEPSSASRSSLAELPGAKDEVEGIVKVVGARAADDRILVGVEATVEGVQEISEQSGDVLHLACHGFSHADDPELSALQFISPPGRANQDALWRAHEIARHQTGHRVVVLSACETGVGRVSGEGVLALSRAFLQAGASSVIASLWRIDDRATARLMPTMHRMLLEGAPPAVALQRMQLQAIQDRVTAHPHAWAAFYLSGAP